MDKGYKVGDLIEISVVDWNGSFSEIALIVEVIKLTNGSLYCYKLMFSDNNSSTFHSTMQDSQSVTFRHLRSTNEGENQQN